MSSFGYSGTIAHALMQRAEDGSSGASSGLMQPMPQLAFRRRVFTWNELDRSSSPRHLTSVYVSCWVVPSDEGARRPSAGARSRVLCVSCGASAPGSTIATTFGAASASRVASQCGGGGDGGGRRAAAAGGSASFSKVTKLSDDFKHSPSF